MNDTMISVRGWAGSDPQYYQNVDEATGKDIQISSTVLNLGVTPRYYSKRTQTWEDEATVWYSVRCYGALARNVKMSVRRGAPLLVRGRFTARSYQDKNGVERTSLQIIADSVAVDLNSVTASYAKQAQLSAQLDAPEENRNNSLSRQRDYSQETYAHKSAQTAAKELARAAA